MPSHLSLRDVSGALCFQWWLCVWEVHQPLKAYCARCIFGAGDSSTPWEVAFLKLLLCSTSFVYFSLLFYFLRQSHFETRADLSHVVTGVVLTSGRSSCLILPSGCHQIQLVISIFFPCGIFDLMWLVLWFPPFVGKVSMFWKSGDCAVYLIFFKFNAQLNGKFSLTECIRRSLSHRACRSVAFLKSLRAHAYLLTCLL